MTDIEKREHDLQRENRSPDTDSIPDLKDPDEGKSEEERAALDKALLRKLDLKIIPWLCLLYLASFLDRTNIGNAKIEGLPKDIHITPGQYNAALSIFFVSYSFFEPLTNLLLKRFQPRVFFTITMVFWGIVMTLMGLVKNYSGLLAARWFLGLFEAGLFPGVNYFLSCYYKRSELGIRAAIFFSAAAVAGSFGGLLAAAISQMDGLAGLEGWRYIFILEGLATVVIGGLSYFFCVNFPAEAHFLSEEERQRVLYRLKSDKQASAYHEKFQFKYIIQGLTDPKTYFGMLIYMGVDGPLYAFSLFLPTIIKGLPSNPSPTRAQLLSVPPYAIACLLTILVGWAADKSRRRGLFNIFTSMLAVLGFGILIGSRNAKLSYAGTYLAAAGIYPCISNTISWTANNQEGVYKRGFVVGLVIGWGNINGIMSSNVYQARDAPWYRPGHIVIFCYLTIGLLFGSIAQHFYLRWENRARRNGKRDHYIQGLSDKEISAMGDKRPDFLYVT
jgi:MFS family permease